MCQHALHEAARAVADDLSADLVGLVFGHDVAGAAAEAFGLKLSTEEYYAHDLLGGGFEDPVEVGVGNGVRGEVANVAARGDGVPGFHR